MAYEETTTKSGKKDMTPERVLCDFKLAYEAKRDWLKEAEQDFEFSLGQQWEDGDVDKLEKAGVKALTINKIRPKIFLLTGLESQNRSDFLAFPEGGEDTIEAEISTRLLKNVMKRSQGDYKVSEQFEDGLTCGEGFIEPYQDYTKDMLSAELQFKKMDFDQIFPEPGCKEYDMSDARYVCKLTTDLTKDEILEFYPGKESVIEKMIDNKKSGTISLGFEAENKGKSHFQKRDYGAGQVPGNSEGMKEPLYDHLDYYYKKWIPKYYVADRKLRTIKEFPSKENANQYVETVNNPPGLPILDQVGQPIADEMGQPMTQPQEPQVMPDGKPIAAVIEKHEPEIWHCTIVGECDEFLQEPQRAWFYPKWKSYHFMPFFAYRSTQPIKKRELKVQGIVRMGKDLQIDLNKRATQELRHLNQSANSGWQCDDDTLTPAQEAAYKSFGSAPGILLKHKADKPAPIKILPTPISSGHEILVERRSQDLKEVLGINSDLLNSQEGGQDSGRAIYLRQKQGLVMVQRVFDNLSHTKRLLGRFILSQLGEVYDIDSAVRVVGEAFLQESFQKPKVIPTPMGEVPAQNPSQPGELVMEFDQQAAVMAMQKVLTDTQSGVYDVSIGEGANNETIKFANYMTLLDMAGKGIPIPPDVLVEESMLSSAHKEKIRKAIEAQAAAQEQAALQARLQPPGRQPESPLDRGKAA